MKSYFSPIAISIMLMTSCAAELPVKDISWTLGAKVRNQDGSISPGFAGAINGVTNDVFLVAGGANFPGKMPWEGGTKYYSNEIHVLERSGNRYQWVKNLEDTLSHPVAYCGNISTPKGIVYAGGEHSGGLSKEAYLLTWNKALAKVEVKRLPDLPQSLTNISLGLLENVVYAIGGDLIDRSADTAFRLDLMGLDSGWQECAPLPKPLANALVVGQHGQLYVIGGRAKNASGISTLYNSTLIYKPTANAWREATPISDDKHEGHFSAGAGVPLGKNFILVTGGDNGQIFHQIESYLAQIAQTKDPAEKARLVALKNDLMIKHQGFDPKVLRYDVTSDKWTKLPKLPFYAQVTTTATMWGDDLVLSNGEIKPGVRTPNIMIGKLK